MGHEGCRQHAFDALVRTARGQLVHQASGPRHETDRIGRFVRAEEGHPADVRLVEQIASQDLEHQAPLVGGQGGGPLGPGLGSSIVPGGGEHGTAPPLDAQQVQQTVDFLFVEAQGFVGAAPVGEAPEVGVDLREIGHGSTVLVLRPRPPWRASERTNDSHCPAQPPEDSRLDTDKKRPPSHV